MLSAAWRFRPSFSVGFRSLQWNNCRGFVYVSAYSVRPTRGKPANGELGAFRFLTENIAQIEPNVLVKATKRASVEGVDDLKLWNSISSRSLEVASLLNFADVASLLHSYALARQTRFDVFSALSDRTVELIQEEKTHNPSTVQAVHDKSEFSDLADAKCEEDGVTPVARRCSFAITDILKYIKAAAALRFSDSRVLTFFSTQFHHHINVLSPTYLADLAISYASLNLRPKDFFYLVAHALPPYVGSFSQYYLAATLGAFSRTAMYYGSLVDALCEAACHVPFSAAHALVFLSSLARLYQKLPPDIHRDDSRTIKIVLETIASFQSNFLLDDWIRVFHALVELRYYDATFMAGTLLPCLNKRVDASLIAREAPCSDRVHRFNTYTRVTELLMRLPPPVSPSVEALCVKVSRAAVDCLAYASVPIDVYPAVRLLRSMSHTKTWTSETCGILLRHILPRVLSQNSVVELHQGEIRVVFHALEWLKRRPLSAAGSQHQATSSQDQQELNRLSQLFYERYKNVAVDGGEEEMVQRRVSAFYSKQKRQRSSHLHHVGLPLTNLADAAWKAVEAQ